MRIWSYVLTITMLIASLCMTPSSSLSQSSRRLLGRSSRRRRRRERRERRRDRREERRRKRRKKKKRLKLKFKGCSDTYDDGKKFSDDFEVAAEFILDNWRDFEKTIEKEADVNIRKCIYRRLEKGKVYCIAPGQDDCDGRTAGYARLGPFSRKINICEDIFLNALKPINQDRRLSCVATLMIHEFAHTCWRKHKSVDKIDIAALNWWRAKKPESAFSAGDKCPAITPGYTAGEIFPPLQFHPDDVIDEPYYIDNHDFHIDTSPHLFTYSAAIMFVLLILFCSGINSMLCGLMISLVTRIRNMYQTKNQTVDIERGME